MKIFKGLFILLCFAAIISTQANAQSRSELAFSLGAGSLQTTPGGGATAVFSFSYQFHISRHFSAEGALDGFTYQTRTGYKDGYLGAEAAAIYSFLNNRETGRWLPFVAAGIGKTTTDFTEIAADRYYRIGAGVAYHFTERIGLRIEIRDEIMKSLHYDSTSMVHLPSARCGIVYRF